MTLAWTDPPPATVTGNAFVNDLDLEVNVGGRTYRGNWLADGHVASPAVSPTSATTSRTWCCPRARTGRMSVKVVAKSLGGDGVPGNATPLDQDFALVVSNAQEQVSSPVLVQGGVTVNDDHHRSERRRRPGAGRVVRAARRACGTPGTEVATGVSATLTGGSGLNVTQAELELLRHHRRRRGAERDAVRGRRCRAAATCGVDATGMLDVTSTEGGTQAVPVTIPTGRPGPPTPHTKTQTIAIPDDNAGGAQSTLFVPVSGRIKDLDVRIDSIDHSFVGDLKVELDEPRQLHDRPPDRARGRAEQRRRRPRRHGLRRRGGER